MFWVRFENTTFSNWTLRRRITKIERRRSCQVFRPWCNKRTRRIWTYPSIRLWGICGSHGRYVRGGGTWDYRGWPRTSRCIMSWSGWCGHLWRSSSSLVFKSFGSFNKGNQFWFSETKPVVCYVGDFVGFSVFGFHIGQLTPKFVVFTT